MPISPVRSAGPVVNLGGPMAADWRRISLIFFALASCLMAAGCAYSGGQSSTFESPGTPIGITSLSGPFEKLVEPAPPPAGFSSTYQKVLVDRQRLARRQDQRDARAKA